MRTRSLVLIALLSASLSPAAASSAPTYRVEWSHGGMLAPYTLGTFSNPVTGTGLFAAGYAGGVAAVGRSGTLWRYADGTQLANAAFGDLTGDGVEDVVLGQYYQLTVLDGRDGSVLLTRPSESAPEGLAITDATGDGRADLYTVTQGRGRNNIVSLLDGTTFEPVWSFDLGSDQQFVLASAAADVDGDGLGDLLFGTYANGPKVYAYRSTGAKLWAADLGGTVSNIELADGGRTVLASRTGALLASLDARTGATRWTLTGPGGFSRLKAADLNGDGTDDAAWALYGARGKSPLFQVQAIDGVTGLPQWAALTGSPPKAVAVGDLDGDGRPDVVATTQDAPQDAQSNFVFGFHGQTGRLLWTKALVGEQTTYLSDAAFVDLVGDSRQEVVAAPYFDTLLGLAGADGAQVWSAPLGSSVIDAVAADLDGDGAQETVEGSTDFRVIVRSAATGAVRWTRDLGGDVLSVGTVPAGTRRDVLAISLSRLYRLRGTDGAALWSFPLHGWGTRAVALSVGGTQSVAVGARLPHSLPVNDYTAGSLALLDAATGLPRWQVETAGAPFHIAVSDVNADGAADLVTGAPIAQGGITAYDGARLATAPVPLWQTATEAGVSGMAVSGGRVLAGLPAVRKVVALNAATGTLAWTKEADPQGARSIGFEDVNGDGALDALVATKIFAERLVALDGTSGATLFDVAAGVRFVKAARWAEISGDAASDLLYASDGGTYGEGGVFAMDGATLGDAEPRTLWSFRGINAFGLTPAVHPDGPAFVAFGGPVLPAAVALLRPVPAQA